MIDPDQSCHKPAIVSGMSTDGNDVGSNICDNNSINISDSCFNPYTTLLNVNGNNDSGYEFAMTEDDNCNAHASFTSSNWDSDDTYGALRGIGNKIVYSHRMDDNLGHDHFIHNNVNANGNMNHSTSSTFNRISTTNSNSNSNSNKCAIYDGALTCDTGRLHNWNVNNSSILMNGFGYQHGSNGNNGNNRNIRNNNNSHHFNNSNSNRYSDDIGTIGGRLNNTASHNYNAHSRLMKHGMFDVVMTNNPNNSNNSNNSNNGSNNPLIWSGMMNRQNMTNMTNMTNMMNIAPIPTMHMGNVINCGNINMPGVPNQYTSNNGRFAKENGNIKHGK